MIVETGEGLSNADSYVALATFKTYCASRAIDLTAYSDATLSAKLVRSTDYVDGSYAFKSVPLTDTQSLQCPRYNVPTVDPRVIRAVCELAIISLTQDIFARPATKELVSEEKTLGPLTTKKAYQVRPDSDDPFPSVTKILGAYANRRGAGASSMRLTA